MTPPNATPRPWRYTEGTNGQIRLMLGKGAYQLVYNVVGELNRLAEKANAHEELVETLRVAERNMTRLEELAWEQLDDGERGDAGPLWGIRSLLARLEREGGGK